ncbi:MAG: FGGY family carbohydrate kinase [Actinobacteria bacterium]|nr:FGGY family carbohydrate kinase [Actinomycetota bacterium]
MDLFLTVDVGTSGVKVAVFDEFCNLLYLTIEEYSPFYPKVDYVEINPEEYYKSLKIGLLKFSKNSKFGTKKIKAISICSQAETFIVFDNNNHPLMNAIVWLDNRAIQESKILTQKFGRKKTYHITGQQDIVPTWTACKLLWLKKNKPELYKKIHKILFVQDFIIYKLTGKFFTDYSLLPSSLLFDIVNLRWWKEMLVYLNISEEQLPKAVGSGEIIGNVTKTVCKDLGLNSDVVVLTGGQDHMAGSIGSGNIRQGIVSETTGTALAICTTIDNLIYDKRMNIPVYIHSIKGKYILLPWSHNSGIILRWFRDKFFNDATPGEDGSKSISFHALDKMAEKVEPGSNRLILLPFFTGAGSPELNPNAKGVFYGISLFHERKHFVRAILESIAYVLRSNIETLRDMSLNIDEIISLGGGSKSDLWCQIKADVLNKKVFILENEEVSSLGLAILCGLAVGKFKDLEIAIKEHVKIKKTFYPNMNNVHLYNDLYKKYKEIYANLKNVF